MVLNEITNELSWYDAGGDNPGWEGEDWVPATEGKEAHQPGLDLTGQTQGFVLDYVPFPDGLLPALHTPEGGFEVELKDGSSVHVRTVWERYIEFLEDANWTIEIEGTALKECGISILANGESVGVINIEDIHQETTWKAPIELNKSGRYEIELQFFAEGEEDLFELDRIRFVKNKIN